jgi:radical SAM protein with 4Fe4S-binding SPASM domain
MTKDKTEDYVKKDNTEISTFISKSGDPNEILASIKGEAFREYRRKWDAAMAMELELSGPLHVDLELNFTCNLRCEMCVFSLSKDEIAKWGNSSKSISYEQAKKILDECKQNGAVSVGFSGVGEPLLNKWLPDLVKYAHDIGYLDIMFNTNGVLMNEEVSRKLIESGLTRIMISLDALTKEVYEKIRIGSDYDKVLNNLETMLSLRKQLNSITPLVRVSIVKTSLNEAQLDDFVEYWSKKVDFVAIQQYENFSYGDDSSNEDDLIKEDLRAASAMNSYKDEFQCTTPWARMLIRHDGTVLPCCSWHGLSLKMGNVFENSLDEIWNSTAWKKLRILHKEGRWADHKICRHCALSYLKTV